MTANNNPSGGTTISNGASYGIGISNLTAQGSYRGTLTGNNNGAAVYFAIPGDTVSAAGNGSNFSGVRIDHNWGGTATWNGGASSSSAAGPRNGLQVNLTQTGAGSGAFQHSAAAFWNTGSWNNGATSYGNANGMLYGINPKTVLTGTSAHVGNYWLLVNGWGEGNIAVEGFRQTATLTGSVTVGDTVSLTISSATVNDGTPITVSATAATGNSMARLVNQLLNAVQQNATLAAAYIGATVNNDASSTVLTVYWSSDLSVTLSSSVSGAATEIVTLGTVTGGASTRDKLGLSIVRLANDSQPAASNFVSNAALNIGSQIAPQTGGWRYGIEFGGPVGSSPFSNAVPTSAIRFTPQNAVGGSNRAGPLTFPSLFSALDFRYVDFTQQSGSPLLFPAFSLSATGTINLAASAIAPTSSGLAISATGYTASGNATVAVGGGGGAGNDQNNYYVGDVVADAFGGMHRVTAVDASTGAVTAVVTLVQPYAATQPMNPITTQYGSGIGLKLSPSWRLANIVALQPTGGLVDLTGATVLTSASNDASAGGTSGSPTALPSQDVTATNVAAGAYWILPGTVGASYVLRNRTGGAINLLPPSGAQIENLGTLTPLSVPDGATVRLAVKSSTMVRVD